MLLNGDCCHTSHAGLKWALACSSVALWALPLWTLHWHHLLREGTHFLAVRSPKDLVRKLAWLTARPECARRGKTSLRRWRGLRAGELDGERCMRGRGVRRRGVRGIDTRI